jgi:DNA-directed RNA polymerase subunit N (RpoN/RPB10)
MIIPTSCFTCGLPISHLWNLYLEKLSTLKNNGGLEEKNDDIKQKNTHEETVFKELNIKRMCCRRMFLTHVDVCDKI